MAHHLLKYCAVLTAAGTACLLAIPLGGAAPRFRPDDPLAREPESQDASGAQPFEIDLGAELLINLFSPENRRPSNEPSANVNTIDEVPDSGWFTNRIYATPLGVDDIARGPNTIEGPAPGVWTVVAAKVSGAAPGFRIRDTRGVVWFLTLDAKGWPSSATGSIAVACRLFWALGYNQVESYLASFRPEDLRVGESATVEPRPNHKRPMTRGDLDAVLARAASNPDGSYRVLAARALPGRVLGGFRYSGTRPDDPNDVVPHERRRELRALKVFAAWTNLTDLKALNTLDTVVDEGGRGVVRHYLQDVGSTFGAGANGPHDWDEGHEYLYEGDATWRRLMTGGLYLRPWQTVPYHEHPEIGRIETAGGFDPEQWKPRTPTAAIAGARDDDTFWAALRVGAFSDALLRAAAHEAHYVDPAAESMLAAVLMERRDVILRTYLPKITPLVRFTLDRRGQLAFENAAVNAGVGPPPANGYRAEWFVFDNTTQALEALGATTAREPRLPGPDGWDRVGSRASYVKVIVTPIDPERRASSRPVQVYFHSSGDGWQLVGLERAVDAR